MPQNSGLPAATSPFKFIFICLLLVVASGCAENASIEADSVIISANLLTLDSENTMASAMAVKNGNIVYVGDDIGVKAFIGKTTRVLQAAGKTIVPGFNDAHVHPVAPLPGSIYIGQDEYPSTERVMLALRNLAAKTPSGQWVIGWGYDDIKLGEHPARLQLDRVSSQHPVLIIHASHHLASANSMAYQGAGITAVTVDPAGGSFARDSDGFPSGVCHEKIACEQLYSQKYPKPDRGGVTGVQSTLKKRFQAWYQLGITSISDAHTPPALWFVYEVAAFNDEPMRVNLMIDDEYLGTAKIIRWLRNFLGSSNLRTQTIKLVHGNSLSGHTAWLNEPYANRPDYYGIPPARSQQELNKIVDDIHQAGFQLAIHSNGDREIEMVLTAIEQALAKHPRPDHRHRIEHASVVSEKILRTVKRLGVVLALHSYVFEHGDKMKAYGKTRYAMMHANKSALEMGIPVAGNSDYPVSRPNPMVRLRSLTTRRGMDGEIYGESQKITPLQALETYTRGGAYASFEERLKGTLEVGKYADYVMLSDNPLEVAPEILTDIKVLRTVIGGDIVYQRKSP